MFKINKDMKMYMKIIPKIIRPKPIGKRILQSQTKNPLKKKKKKKKKMKADKMPKWLIYSLLLKKYKFPDLFKSGLNT